MNSSPKFTWTALFAAAALALTACGAESEAEAEADESANKEVTIGYVVWDEVLAPTYLWKHLLEEKGYEVELVQLEIAAVYSGVSQGDLDIYIGGLRETHADYWDEFGDGFEIVSEWYEPLRHGLAVPDYVEDVNSIEDLAGQSDRFGGQIVGIEAGSGLMQELEEANEIYDLEGYDITGSSTAAMLQEFDTATSNDEDIVATVWNPHWAVAEYDMKFLDDPEEIFEDGDIYTVIATADADLDEDLLNMLSNFDLEDEPFYDLLGELREAGEGNEEQAVENWLGQEDNADLVEDWVQ